MGATRQVGRRVIVFTQLSSHQIEPLSSAIALPAGTQR
jgi:hypothetical protein